MEVPKVSSVVLIRGAQTVSEAIIKAKKTEGWKSFQGIHADADVVAVEFAGHLEN